MANNRRNYSRDKDTLENYNPDDRYDNTGESEFSRESTIPFDQDEVLSERHYSFGPLYGKERVRVRELPPDNHRGRGPKGYRKSDEAIKEDVSEALYRSTEVDASEIEVFVSQGHVTLKGTVINRFQKKQAEAAVEHLAGVDDVFNELYIRDPNAHQDDWKVSKKGLIQNITGLN